MMDRREWEEQVKGNVERPRDYVETIHACARCGCLVWNEEAHDQFHITHD